MNILYYRQVHAQDSAPPGTAAESFASLKGDTFVPVEN